MKITRCLFTYLLFLLATGKLLAVTCTTTGSGTWDCGTPSAGDILIVNHDVTISGDWVSSGNITVNAGAALTVTGKFDISGSAIVTVDGTLNVSGNSKILNSASLIVNGTMNASGITFDNTSTGTVTGVLNMTGDLELKGTSSVTVESGGSLSAAKFIMNAGTTFTVESGADSTFSNTVDIKAGADATINGTFNTDLSLKINGTICGTGSVTYDSGAGCSGAGTACGDAGWCDGSGSIESGTLPIKLVYFKGHAENNSVKITWQTATELNNDFFTILRSVDGEDYKEIQTISGAGNSDILLTYQAFDENPASGTSYYRLKQTDFDGKFEYFGPIAVQFTGESGFKVYPNPVSNHELRLNLIHSEGPTDLVITSLLGKEIYAAQYSAGESGRKVSVQLPHTIAPGVYMLSISNATETFRSKLWVR